jgi:hypothetical protein
MSTPRIYADFNGFETHEDGHHSVALDTLGSLRELTNAGLRLRDGLQLTIYDWSDAEEDLEAVVTVRYDRRRSVWLAEFAAKSYVYVRKQDRAVDERFLCLGCRADLATSSDERRARMPRGDVCPHCGAPTASAIAPPAASYEASCVKSPRKE